MTDDIRIRPAVPADAGQIADMANRLNVSEGIGETLYDRETIERDAFGPTPAFDVLIAEAGGRAVGYASFHDNYNSDLAQRGVWLVDLFVEAGARRRGIGRMLLAATAKAARDRGAHSVWWGVRSANEAARAFYATIGAEGGDGLILGLDGAALADLAETA